MSFVTPELIGQLIDAHAAALELFAAQWPCSAVDVVQDAFIEFARLPAPPDNARAWLFRVVRNGALGEVRSSLRRRRRELVVGAERSARFVADRAAALQPSDAAEALAGLSQELREVVVARMWGGLTFEQIGELTETSTSTAARRYEEAISILRTRLGVACPNKKMTAGC